MLDGESQPCDGFPVPLQRPIEALLAPETFFVAAGEPERDAAQDDGA